MNLGPYELNQIYTGDARILSDSIPDNSVDLIFTDPVYWQIEDYAWLAELGATVLKEGGNLIAQVGSEYRFEAEKAMRESSLISRPLIAEVFPSATAQMWKHRTFTGWKPYIWFSKGNRSGQWCFDRKTGGGSNKLSHMWGDSTDFFFEYLQRLTDFDAIILDPFAGGGTVPAVCKMLGRNYLAFEIDPATADRARERVQLTQPPLFVTMPEQLSMMEIEE